MTKKRKKETELYDFFGVEGKLPSKAGLRYKNRAAIVKDPGVIRAFSRADWGTEKDNLCKIWWGGMLTGGALEEAKLICPPAPPGYVLPARFMKPLSEHD